MSEVICDFQMIFSKDFHDGGVTDLHTVSIPTAPNMPPMFVHQYKIQLAAYKLIQKILNMLLKE